MAAVDSTNAEVEVLHPLDQWAELIRADLGRAVEGLIAAGRHLLEAKAQHPGGFVAWLNSSQSPVKRMTAYRLMKVAERFDGFPALGNLPPDKTALYELTQLEPEQLRAAVKAGEVHRSMSPTDVRQVVFAHRNRQWEERCDEQLRKAAAQPSPEPPAQVVDPPEASGADDPDLDDPDLDDPDLDDPGADDPYLEEGLASAVQEMRDILDTLLEVDLSSVGDNFLDQLVEELEATDKLHAAMAKKVVDEAVHRGGPRGQRP